MQSPQISTGAGAQAGSLAQSSSWQSIFPSPSLSRAALQTSTPQPAIGRSWHTPAAQTSVVQALPSSQSAAVLQGRQPAMVVSSQLPEALHTSMVQGLESLQSVVVVQRLQPGTARWPHTPASQVSVVRVLPWLRAVDGVRR